MIIKKEEAESLFKKWLKGIENVEIHETEIENVVDYLKKNMQEEVASWSEDRVREKVKDWWIVKEREKERKEEDYYEEDKGNETKIVSDRKSGGSINLKRVEVMKSKIEKLVDGDKAKEILINLLNDHPEIANYIERYMDELI